MAARAAGHEVAYVSARDLTPSPEAYLTAFLLPSMAQGRDLEIEAEVDETWLANVDRVRRFVRATWPSWSGGAVRAEGTCRLEPGAGAGRALCFGGGVDSLFSLHQGRRDLDGLLFVGGFDVSPTDRDRRAAVIAHDSAVAEAAGLVLHVVDTNLRDHPLYRQKSWLKLYGGALASAAHVLQRHVRACAVSGWGHITEPLVRGSHPDLEPGWSSGAVTFAFTGHEHSRTAKIEKLVDWDVFRDHLRVCWESPSAALNCGRCEKCVRTRLQLVAAGAPNAVRTFPPVDLAATIDAVDGVPAAMIHYYDDLRARIDDAGVRDALSRLLGRSPPRGSRWRGLTRVLRRANERSTA